VVNYYFKNEIYYSEGEISFIVRDNAIIFRINKDYNTKEFYFTNNIPP